MIAFVNPITLERLEVKLKLDVIALVLTANLLIAVVKARLHDVAITLPHDLATLAARLRFATNSTK